MTTPLTGITVALLDGATIVDTTVTDVNGEYQFDSVYSSITYTVSAGGEGRTDITNNVPATMTSGLVSSVNITLSALPAPPAPVICSDPSMLVTVTGSSGTINWCGETWVLPGDSGDQKEVCPTGYSLDRGITTGYAATNTTAYTPFTFFVGANLLHSWKHTNSAATGVDLQLLRGMKYGGNTAAPNFTAPGPPFQPWYWGTWNAYDEIGVKSSFDRKKWTAPAGPAVAIPHINNLVSSVFNIGELSASYPAVGPSYSDYQILNGYFNTGSHTIGGITYAWEKGTGWPT